MFCSRVGQVGSALIEALLASQDCTEVVMVTRRPLDRPSTPEVRQIILDMAAEDFSDQIAWLANNLAAEDQPLFAASCIGIGQGSRQWSDEAIRRLEIGVVGGFARGCLAPGVERFGLLSAAGSSARSMIRYARSTIRYARIMGEKEGNLRGLGFRRLAILRPGIIAGNGHTPGWVATLGRLVPGAFGTIEQQQIARAFIGEFLNGRDGVTVLDNHAIRLRSRGLHSA